MHASNTGATAVCNGCCCVALQEMQLSAALAAAADLGLDLVEVNAKGQPPVAR
jgi:translation initiation factor IF-3